MKKYLFAVDFGNRGSKFFEIVAANEKDGREAIWSSLNNADFDRDFVECIEMIDFVDEPNPPVHDWMNKPVSVPENNVMSWGK